MDWALQVISSVVSFDIDGFEVVHKVIDGHFPHVLQQKTEHGRVIVCAVRQDYIVAHQVVVVHFQVFRRKNPVVAADKGVIVVVFVPFEVLLKPFFSLLIITFMLHVSKHLEVPLPDEPQFFLDFIEVPSGSYFHEGLVGVAVLAHAAQELLERGGGEFAREYLPDCLWGLYFR